MNVPGVNVLGLALGVIARTPVTLFTFVKNERQANGVDLPTYAPGVAITGSVQAVSSKTKMELGLEWQDEYVTLFTSALVRAIERDGAGDVFVWNGKYYHGQGGSDWTGQDGWNEVLAVKIRPLTPAQIVTPTP